MPLPHWVARINRRFTNRFIEPLARRSPGFAVVHHRGRRSGTAYRTPVNVFEANGELVVALTYGAAADWIRNVQAGPAAIERKGKTVGIEAVGLTTRPHVWGHLPFPVRIALRVLTVRDFAVLSVPATVEVGPDRFW